jgi:hypothetical protein
MKIDRHGFLKRSMGFVQGGVAPERRSRRVRSPLAMPWLLMA